MVTKNFILGICTETLEIDEDGSFMLSHSDIGTAPDILTREQASAWFAKHYPDRSLGDIISLARKWFASRQDNLSETKEG